MKNNKDTFFSILIIALTAVIIFGYFFADQYVNEKTSKIVLTETKTPDEKITPKPNEKTKVLKKEVQNVDFEYVIDTYNKTGKNSFEYHEYFVQYDNIKEAGNFQVPGHYITFYKDQKAYTSFSGATLQELKKNVSDISKTNKKIDRKIFIFFGELI